MSEYLITARFDATGLGDVRSKLKGLGKDVHGVEKRGQRATSVLTNGFQSFRRAITLAGGALGGLSLAAATKSILSLDDRLGQIQANARFTNSEMIQLKNQFLALGAAAGKTPEEMVDVMEVLQDFGGILRGFGQDAGAKIADFMEATGTGAREAATLAATLHQSLGILPKDIDLVFGKLIAQANAGNVSLAQLSRILPELFAQAGALGVKGSKGVEQFGSALQIIAQALPGRPEQVRTAFLGTIRAFTKLVDNKTLRKKFKIDPFEADKKTLRNPLEVMAELIRKSRGEFVGKMGLSQVFDEEGKKAAMVFISAFDQATGKFKGNAAQIIQAGEQGGALEIVRQRRTRRGGVSESSQKVKRTWAEIQSTVQKEGAKIINWVMDNPALSLAIGAGGYGALKFGKFGISKLAGSLVGRKGAGAFGGIAGAIGKSPIPVYIVNNPFGNAAAGVTGPMPQMAGGAAGGPSTLGKVAAVASAGLMGYALGQTIDQLFDVSGMLSDVMLRGTEWFRRETTDYSKDANTKNILDLSERLVELSQMGNKTFEMTKGQRVDLNQANAMAVLKRYADNAGMSAKAFAELKPELMKVVSLLAKPVVVNAPGVDKPQIMRSRGGA